jgi:hypothetical protein
VELAVDLDVQGSPGMDVELQLLVSAAATGGVSPDVAVAARRPARTGEVTHVTVALPADADWVLLRVADPTRGYGGTAPDGHPAAVHGVAYASPWYAPTSVR